MSKNPKSKGGPFLSLCASVEKIAARLLDAVAFSGARLKAIEDRIASLDGGPGAEAAARIAFDKVNDERRGAGKPTLDMKRP